MKTPVPTRLVGSIASNDILKQVLAIQLVADVIEDLSISSHNQNKISEELFSLEKKNSMIARFPMEGTDPVFVESLMTLSQNKALEELEWVQSYVATPDAN